MNLLQPGKKIYFASDCHFGVPDYESSLKREKLFVQWLDEIKQDAAEIYLLGDIFDFWFEYKTVVPRGYARLLGKLAEISDSGIPIYYFKGNHDMWMFNYFEEELNITMHREPVIKEINGKRFYLAHGDGLGPGDHGYKFIKKVFSNKICQWLFARLHPNFSIGLALYFSRKSRNSRGSEDNYFHGEESLKERLIVYAKEISEKQKIDYFIFGHRHFPLSVKLNEKSMYYNIGDWITHFSYLVFDGDKVEVKTYKSNFNEV